MDGKEYLSRARDLPIRSLRDVIGDGGIVVVAPHPDDESLGCGGLIAEACALSLAVRLIFISDGTGSHPNSPSFPKPRLLLEREMEARKASAILGVAPTAITFLRLPDRSVPIEGRDAERAVSEILCAVTDIQASAIFVTSDLDSHCDHRASFSIVRQVHERLLQTHVFTYPIWAWRSPELPSVPNNPEGFRLDVKQHISRKRAAIEQHRTQLGKLIQDDPEGFQLEPEMIDFFLVPYETYLEPPL